MDEEDGELRFGERGGFGDGVVLGEIDFGATLFADGGLSSGGLINNGDLILSSTTVAGPVTSPAGSTITVLGDVIFNDLVSGGGFFGPGTAIFNGGMAPGASPAEVAFEGSVALAETNTLFIEIGGATLGDDYDSLTIAGDASLDGIVDVALIDGFVPTAGQQFTILTASSIVDNGLALGGSAASSFDLFVGTTSVILQAIAAGLPGDFDNDGDVDGRDFLLWQRGGSPSPLSASDLADWQAGYGVGASMAVSTAAEAASPVPEPKGIVLCVISGFFCNWFCYRSKLRP